MNREPRLSMSANDWSQLVREHDAAVTTAFQEGLHEGERSLHEPVAKLTQVVAIFIDQYGGEGGLGFTKEELEATRARHGVKHHLDWRYVDIMFKRDHDTGSLVVKFPGTVMKQKEDAGASGDGS
jgi:hypothetical protein